MAQKNHYEGDDIMATYTKQVAEKEGAVHLMTGDKDLEQLKVYPGVSVGMWSPIKTSENTIENPYNLVTTLGVPPRLVVDYLALCGDSSDNFPGCKGIGPVTTKKLLREFGSLERILRYAAIRAESSFDTGWIVKDLKLSLAKKTGNLYYRQGIGYRLHHHLDKETWELLMYTFHRCIGAMYQWVYADRRVSEQCDSPLPRPFTDRIFRLINENLDKVEQARELATLYDTLSLESLDNFKYQPPDMETAESILIGEYGLQQALLEISRN